MAPSSCYLPLGLPLGPLEFNVVMMMHYPPSGGGFFRYSKDTGLYSVSLGTNDDTSSNRLFPIHVRDMEQPDRRMNRLDRLGALA